MTRPSCLHGAAACSTCMGLTMSDAEHLRFAKWVRVMMARPGRKPWAWASLPGLGGGLIATAIGHWRHYRLPTGAYRRGGWGGWYWLESERRPSRKPWNWASLPGLGTRDYWRHVRCWDGSWCNIDYEPIGAHWFTSRRRPSHEAPGERWAR